MRAPLTRRCAAAAIALGGAAGLPAASLGIDPDERADELRAIDAQLAAEERAAAVELYALETRLARARDEFAAHERRAAAAARTLRAAQARLAAAAKTLRATERFLAARLRMLYEQGRTDPVAVVLGAESLEAALDRLDTLRFAADQDRRIVQRTLATKQRLVRLTRTLEARRAELLALGEAAAARAEALVQATRARRGYIAQLASERGLNAARLAELQEQAQAAREQAQRISVAAPAGGRAPAGAPERPVPVAASGATMTVVATAYHLPGRTATGLPVGVGVVAVDPSVIPLGTRLTIPGYGTGVAADTGSAVRGAKIDVWLPTRAQALAWGTRTVTVTIH